MTRVALQSYRHVAAVLPIRSEAISEAPLPVMARRYASSEYAFSWAADNSARNSGGSKTLFGGLLSSKRVHGRNRGGAAGWNDGGEKSADRQRDRG
jgi:hypothetical protein